jgi:DNA-binding transcriptional regulator YiaG
MSWWFRVPAAFGLRPEMREVGFDGLLAWMALLAVDAQNDFAGDLPARFVTPSYLALQYPEGGPGPDALERGLQRCVEARIAVDTGEGIRLVEEVYESWRAPKSERLRKREQRDRDRGSREVTPSHAESRTVTRSHAESRGVTDGHAKSRSVTAVTNVTVPDQTIEISHTNAGARVGGPGVEFAAEREALAVGHDEAARALGVPAEELAQLEAGEREPSQAEAEELERLLRRARGELRPGLDEQRVVLRCERRDVAKALWRYQDEVRQRVLPEANPLKCADLPGGPLDAVVLLLATWSPADCAHALDMASLEAQARQARGEEPFEWLNGRTNWKPEQFERLVQATPDQIRARASPKAAGSKRTRPAVTSMPAAPPDAWQAITGRRRQP